MLNILINIYFNVQFVKLAQQEGEEMGKTFENTTEFNKQHALKCESGLN